MSKKITELTDDDLGRTVRVYPSTGGFADEVTGEVVDSEQGVYTVDGAKMRYQIFYADSGGDFLDGDTFDYVDEDVI